VEAKKVFRRGCGSRHFAVQRREEQCALCEIEPPTNVFILVEEFAPGRPTARIVCTQVEETAMKLMALA
jgi:hypothetical protein